MALVAVGLLAFPFFWMWWFWVSSLERAGGFSCCRRVQQEHLDFLSNSFGLVSRNFSDAVIISVVLVFAVSFNIFGLRCSQFSWK